MLPGGAHLPLGYRESQARPGLASEHHPQGLPLDATKGRKNHYKLMSSIWFKDRHCKGSFRVFHHQKAFMEKGRFSMDERWPSVITAGTAEIFKLKKKKKTLKRG